MVRHFIYGAPSNGAPVYMANHLRAEHVGNQVRSDMVAVRDLGVQSAPRVVVLRQPLLEHPARVEANAVRVEPGENALTPGEYSRSFCKQTP